MNVFRVVMKAGYPQYSQLKHPTHALNSQGAGA